MKDKDAAVIKALAELGLRKEKELDDGELGVLNRALNPDDFWLDDVEKLFKEKEECH